jgi:hypothetical protein
MFTTKLLSEIKRELAVLPTHDREQITDWLEREAAAQRRSRDAKVSEDFIWPRKILNEAARAEKSRRGKSTKGRTKKTTARSVRRKKPGNGPFERAG